MILNGVILVVFMVVCFGLGYYILPWIIHGVSPRQTWRRDHRKENW